MRALRLIGMETAIVGSQTGDKEDYKQLQEMADPGTIIVDDANPLELAKFCLEKDVDLFIGGVKERPIAYKLGIGFCDHNHERKEPLAGYIGMLNFAKEVYASVASPVWQFAPRARRWQAASSAVARHICRPQSRNSSSVSCMDVVPTLLGFVVPDSQICLPDGFDLSVRNLRKCSAYANVAADLQAYWNVGNFRLNFSRQVRNQVFKAI